MLVQALAFWLMFVFGGPGLRLQPPLLLVDDASRPHVRIAWLGADGVEHVHESDLSYGWDADRKPIGANIAAYAAAGGTRLLKGATHPKGAVMRFGFYKIEEGLLFFDQVESHTVIDVQVTGIRMNQSAVPLTRTIVQHLKFSRDSLKACRVPSDAWNLFNTVDPGETMKGRIRAGYDARPGALDGQEGHGSAWSQVEPDGSISMHVRVPYALFKHIRDPWKNSVPGTFLEPMHFHIEIEILPQGVEPEQPSLPSD
ncbi:MAG: hypothetical protein DYG94_04950 [Leptolyngbya sp. PLA3]|nr:MAG: hypothetical protein EDM82_04100 [Cyanobacteria bacterium CYA]MCE7968081.1 hypothetical protein [Leptolyngbya sp. PL-A3]